MKTRGFAAWKTLRTAAVTLVLTSLLGACATNGLGATEWVTGADLRSRLAQPVPKIRLDGPLRQALKDLSRGQRVAVLIDRRVDPGRKLELQLEQVPLEAALQEIARRQQLGICVLGAVAYFGPPRVSSRLRTLAALRGEEIRRLPAGAQQRFLWPKRLAWDDFAQPRELLRRLAEESGLDIRGLDRVPHDLWAAADLPPLSLVDRLTLIVVQFDLTFLVGPDGKTVTLIPLPDEVALVRSYPGGPQPKATAAKYALLVPDTQIKVVGNQVQVKGLLEAHELLASPRRPPKGPKSKATDQGFAHKRFTFRAKEQPVERLLQELARELQLQLVIDRQALQEAGISLEPRVSLSVESVTIDQLLHEVVKSTRLRFHRRGNVVEITPAE